MESRLDFAEASPKVMQAMVALETAVKKLGIEQSLYELVKLRASQINGCAFCVDMHTRDALAEGEDPRRLSTIIAWREAPFYTERERAALAWTEAITRIADTHAPDADYQALRAQFSEEEAVNLTLLISTINCWNRLAIGFRKSPPEKV